MNASVSKISCRDIFSNTLEDMAKKDSHILVITSDAMGSCSLTGFAAALPKQFVDVGIAEQNEIGVAAGLAAMGKKPFVCAPACFISARSFEQIKVDVAYSGQNVKILGVSGGVSYGPLGATHHSLHDIAALRTIPNISIILPCDGHQTKDLLTKLVKTETPAYIRLGRNPVPIVYESNTPFTIGKGHLLKPGNDLTIIATGETVWHSLKAAEILATEGVSARVIDMHTLKPFDEEIVVKAAKETSLIITVEEHSIHGGLGGAVSQCVAGSYPCKVKSIAIPDEFAVPGNTDDLFEHYGLNYHGIIKTAKREVTLSGLHTFD